MGISNPLITLFLNLGLVAVLLVGAVRVMDGVCLPGKIISFIQYFTLLSNAMLAMTRIFMMYTKGAASMGRITEVLDAAKSAPEAPRAENTSRSAPSREAYLTFENVTFSYSGRSPAEDGDASGCQLKDVSFSLPKGGTLGVIGATGSGKTTLLALLMRFYDTSEGGGRILLDGCDIRSLPTETLREKFGIAMQNDFIMAGSIKQNIVFGRDISMSDVQRAARIAQAEGYIEALADGYDHMLNAKGTNLSGGQKQRLLIARAIAGRPEILMLDDASSALDYRTDAALRQALRDEKASEDGLISADTTTILVAQRVSSVKDADLILVLDGGEIIGCGDHDTLMETCEIYGEIALSQMGGAILD
jgi:ATP-binding cassette subfamily B protein